MSINTDKRPITAHIGRYNFPWSSEVAAIIPGSEHGQVGGMDIVLRMCNSLNSNVSEVFYTVSLSHLSYYPLSYVLPLPNGSYTWYPELVLTPPGGPIGTDMTPTIFVHGKYSNAHRNSAQYSIFLDFFKKT